MRVSINYAFLGLMRAIGLYLLLAHWSACALVLPSTFYDTRADTWLGYYGFCSPHAGCVETLVIYVATLSHTLQLINGGTGGELDHASLNTQEQAVYMVISVIGSLLWG